MDRPRIGGFALLATVVAAGCLGSARASAAIVPTSPHPGHGASVQIFGNGKFNKNSFLVNTNLSDHAVQAVRNGNAGGKIINNEAMCKWKINCKLIQRAVIFDP